MERNVAQGIEGIVVEGNVAAGALEHLEQGFTRFLDSDWCLPSPASTLLIQPAAWWWCLCLLVTMSAVIIMAMILPWYGFWNINITCNLKALKAQLSTPHNQSLTLTFIIMIVVVLLSLSRSSWSKCSPGTMQFPVSVRAEPPNASFYVLAMHSRYILCELRTGTFQVNAGTVCVHCPCWTLRAPSFMSLIALCFSWVHSDMCRRIQRYQRISMPSPCPLHSRWTPAHADKCSYTCSLWWVSFQPAHFMPLLAALERLNIHWLGSIGSTWACTVPL